MNHNNLLCHMVELYLDDVLFLICLIHCINNTFLEVSFLFCLCILLLLFSLLFYEFLFLLNHIFLFLFFPLCHIHLCLSILLFFLLLLYMLCILIRLLYRNFLFFLEILIESCKIVYFHIPLGHFLLNINNLNYFLICVLNLLLLYKSKYHFRIF